MSESWATLLASEQPLELSYQKDEIVEFFTALALCHSVYVDHHVKPKNDGRCGKTLPPSLVVPLPVPAGIAYHASSPDEEALVTAAARFGVVLTDVRACSPLNKRAD